eukprot:TRINITY_DN4112_c0_g1_i3.p1 TRINITY_DN4112_c0_g1~~TRINITY_DN4112_c0_g1_i3.p1  ORF type:complete len:1259 (-),score=365.16 TRINITY_DN4112_c0_g1_i3:66-3842(-)
MSSKKEKDKSAKNLKKLNNFFDKNASLSKRFKSMTSYVERASDEELNRFFNEHFYMIYGVFLDTFSAYESNCKKNKHSSSEVQDLLTVLRNVLVHLAELVRKRWQIRSIASVLEKVLYKENKHAIRQNGFELLIYFLEAVGTPDDAQIDVFGSAIDLQVFLPEHAGTTFPAPTLSAPDKTGVLSPSSTPNTIENGVQLLELLLDHMTQRPENFEFWFELFKTKYLIIFYPSVCEKIGLLTSQESKKGFHPHAPHQVQTVIISRLGTWMRNDHIVKILWTSEQNVDIMLEIYRQSCYLPIRCDNTIKKSIAVYRNLFLSETPAVEIKPRIVEYRKFFLQKLSVVFATESPTDDGFKHTALCLEILQLFKYMFVEAFDTLEDGTQEVLLYTLLDTTTTLLRKSSPNALLAENLASVMLDTVLFVWIRTKTRSEELWTALQTGIAGLFHSLEPVVQTHVKALQLTTVIKDLIYYHSGSGHQRKKPEKGHQEGKQTKVITVARSIDYAEALPEIKRDPAICEMQWSVDDVVYAWRQVLNIFQNVNQIQDPKIHCEAIKSLTSVVRYIMSFEDEVPYEEYIQEGRPKRLCLIDIFGPWLFEATTRAGQFMRGIAEAYSCLCTLLTRSTIHEYPIELLSHFYDAIRRGLTVHRKSTVAGQIIVNSSNIFNRSLPGVNVLIPYYLAEIKGVLATAEAPELVKKKAITILCSLISYSSHLNGLSIPVAGKAGDGDDVGEQAQPMKFSELRKAISSTLVATLNSDPLPEHKVMCLWGLCGIQFEELMNTKSPSKKYIDEIQRVIISFCTHSDMAVVRAALDCVSALTQCHNALSATNPRASSWIVEVLCSNITSQLKEGRGGRTMNEQVVAEHYFTLLEWLVAGHMDLFDSEKLANKVFEAIELGMLGETLTRSAVKQYGNVTVVGAGNQDDPATVAKEEKSKKDKKKGRMSVREPQTSVQNKQISTINQLLEHLTDRPAHGSLKVKDAATVLLTHINHIVQNFPKREGIDIFSGMLADEDDTPFGDEKAIEDAKATGPAPAAAYKNTLFYIHNNLSVFSVSELPAPDKGGPFARLYMRDSTGRYAWDFKLAYDKEGRKSIQPPCSLLTDVTPEAESASDETEEVESKREKGQPPLFVESPNDLTKTDQLNELLRYLSEACPDCPPDHGDKPLDIPADSISEKEVDVTTAESSLLEQASADRKVQESLVVQRPPPEHWNVIPPSPPLPQSEFHFARLLMSHLGFFNFERSEERRVGKECRSRWSPYH